MSAPAGPYIVRIDHQCPTCGVPAGVPCVMGRADSLAHREPHESRPAASRWAYATLEEVREAAHAIVHRVEGEIGYGLGPDLTRARCLPESSSTINLLDGSEIVVEATTYERLWNQLPALARQALPAPPPDRAWERAVLAAWNAEYGIEREGAER